MVWNWDKDDIRGRERERERESEREGEKERDRDYLRKIYTIILNIYLFLIADVLKFA